MIGDVVGESGLAALEQDLPALITRFNAALVIVNGENAADGFGLTEASYQRIRAAGADVVTSGNHIWEKNDFRPFLDSEERMLRPANYPQGVQGHGAVKVAKEIDGAPVEFLIINLQGREMMFNIDCPFRAFDSILQSEVESAPADSELATRHSPLITVIDFHAETTREKEAFAAYIDGRAAVLAGTHTHVPTSDERILPKGTAYITDLGMTGAKDSCLGMDEAVCLERARKQVLYKMTVSNKEGAVHGIHVAIDTETGKAVSIERI
jgi:metallophosphoesterase (TIGR00282 family)